MVLPCHAEQGHWLYKVQWLLITRQLNLKLITVIMLLNITWLKLESIQPKAQMIYEEQLIKKFKANPESLYAYIKTKQKVKDTISHLVKEDSSIVENNEDIATVLDHFFQTTFSKETLDHIPELPERSISNNYY